MSEPDTDTDPGGHEPPPPYSDASIRVLSEHLVKAVQEAVQSELSELRKEMTAHQQEEMLHHKRTSASLKLLVKQMRSQNKRIAELTARVEELEGKGPVSE